MNYSVCWITLRRAFQAEGIAIAKSWGRAPLARLMFCAYGQSWRSRGEYLSPRQVEPHKPGSDIFYFQCDEKPLECWKKGKDSNKNVLHWISWRSSISRRVLKLRAFCWSMNVWMNELLGKSSPFWIREVSAFTVLTCTFLKGDLLAGAVATLWLHKDANSWHCHWLLPVFSEVNMSNHH